MNAQIDTSTDVRKIHTISLGAGVQSSTMALMAAHGEIDPMPDAAIFADTGWEPKAVMDYLDWLETKLPFPVYRVMQGRGIKQMLLDDGSGRYSAIPYFLSNGGLGMRQCSKDYKIVPIQKKMRELLGYKQRQRIPAQSAVSWIGISLDEAVRQKPSRERWIENRWPLLEKRMTRGHCLEWLQDHGYPLAPKSSCLGCPYHSDKQWLEIKSNPQEWEETVMMDKAIRTTSKLRHKRYMHRSLVPLDQVVFEESRTLDMFGNDCEGICGV